MGNNVGIWLDSHRAVIISLVNGEPHIKEVHNNLESYQNTKGSRSSSPWGPQDVGSGTNELERTKHQMKIYFDAIIDHVKNAKAVMVFGPAEAKVHFEKEFLKHKDIAGKLLAVETSDKMTDNQMTTHVREFYKNL